MQCKCYTKFGHNKRACPKNPTNKNKKTRHYKIINLYIMSQTCLYWSDLTI